MSRLTVFGICCGVGIFIKDSVDAEMHRRDGVAGRWQALSAAVLTCRVIVQVDALCSGAQGSSSATDSMSKTRLIRPSARGAAVMPLPPPPPPSPPGPQHCVSGGVTTTTADVAVLTAALLPQQLLLLPRTLPLPMGSDKDADA